MKDYDPDEVMRAVNRMPRRREPDTGDAAFALAIALTVALAIVAVMCLVASS